MAATMWENFIFSASDGEKATLEKGQFEHQSWVTPQKETVWFLTPENGLQE